MKEFDLFKPIRREHSTNSAGWFTWSDEMRETLNLLQDCLISLQAPKLIHLENGAPYDYTYTLCAAQLPKDLRRKISRITYLLLRVTLPRKRLMLSALLQANDSKHLIHVFFSLLYDTLARETRRPTSAMYAPLGTTGAAAGEFRLHADLYRPSHLLNVFNDVPEDGTGASTFLSLASFKRILRNTSSLPHIERSAIEGLFENERTEDGYERFVSLVHGEKNPWRDELWKAMALAQEVIPLRRGEGYLLNDRAWLHGRTEPSNNVSRFRVHRLVFG